MKWIFSDGRHSCFFHVFVSISIEFVIFVKSVPIKLKKLFECSYIILKLLLHQSVHDVIIQILSGIYIRVTLSINSWYQLFFMSVICYDSIEYSLLQIPLHRVSILFLMIYIVV